MATPKGNFTAYQQTQSIKLNVAEEAKNVAAADQANQAAKEAKHAKEVEARNKVAENFKTDTASLTNIITGTKSLDQAFARGVGQARDMMGDIYQQIQKNPRMANDVDVQMRLNNLKNYSKKLKASTDMLTDFNTKLAQGRQDGTLSAWNDKHLNMGESMYIQKNFNVGVDLNGNAVGATIELDDEGEPVLGEDGQPILSAINLPQILDGGGLPELVPTYQLVENAKSLGKELGKREGKRDEGGFRTYAFQTFEDAELEARGLIKGMIGSSKNPTAIAKSIWSTNMGNKAKDLTDDDMKAIEDEYIKSIRPFYDEFRNKETDYSARNQANENYRKSQKDKADAAAKEEKTVNTDITVITDENEEVKKTIFDLRDGLELVGSATSLSLPVDKKTKRSNMTVVGPNGNEILIDQLHLMDNGDIGYTGYEYKGKATGQSLSPSEVNSFRNRDTGKLSNTIIEKKIGGGIKKGSTVMTQIAKQMNLDNEGQLKALLEEGFT